MNVAADTQFTKSAFLEFLFFFPKSCLKVGGAAYTRERLIHESLRYVFDIILQFFPKTCVIVRYT